MREMRVMRVTCGASPFSASCVRVASTEPLSLGAQGSYTGCPSGPFVCLQCKAQDQIFAQHKRADIARAGSAHHAITQEQHID